MNDGLPEISRTERSAIVGDGIAEMLTTEDGRAFLLEIAARLQLAPSVMDATKEQFTEAAQRARCAVAAADIIGRFSWSEEWPTLGSFVAALPEDVREQVADHLFRAGLS